MIFDAHGAAMGVIVDLGREHVLLHELDEQISQFKRVGRGAEVEVVDVEWLGHDSRLCRGSKSVSSMRPKRSGRSDDTGR